MGLPGPPVLVEESSPPYGESHYLEPDIDVPAEDAHGSVMSELEFEGTWQYLLGTSPDAPCGGERVYADEPGALLVEIAGGGTLAFGSSKGAATITIPGSAWASIVAERSGGCSVDGGDGLLCGSVSDYTVAIDLQSEVAVPGQSYWTAQLIEDGSIVDLTAREPDVAEDGYFYQEVDGQVMAIACSEASSIPGGSCLPAELRAPVAYDPVFGTLTYLGVVESSGALHPTYALARFSISEVPEPSSSLLGVTLLGVLAGLRRARWPASGRMSKASRGRLESRPSTFGA